MLRFVVRRLLLLLPILFGVSILVFAWVHKLPGGPLESLLGERATPELVQQYREQYGLDKPLPVQYVKYVKELVRGNLGVSTISRRAVTVEISDRFPATIELAFAAMLLAVFVGVPLGFLAAKYHGGATDHLTMVGSLIGISIPVFFLAIILKYIFAVRLGWLPTVGREDVLATRDHPTNFYTLDAILQADWGAFVDAVKHLLLSGAVLTETVFAYPGMGFWLRDAIFNRDYPVLQGGIMFLALVFVLVNLLVDISYAVINPRIRYS